VSEAGGLLRLKAFARREATERCGLCSSPVAEVHAHLLDVKRGVLECSCASCGLLFSQPGTGTWRPVIPLSESWPDFRIDDGTWDALAIPIGLAYFVRSSAARRVVAHYPSPAGAVESQLSLEGWRTLTEQNPRLASMTEDVEALLVNRMGGVRECFRVSIDECFALVGLVRARWRGFTGGAELREGLKVFFDRLRGGARA
jgi:hypothetical protein